MNTEVNHASLDDLLNTVSSDGLITQYVHLHTDTTLEEPDPSTPFELLTKGRYTLPQVQALLLSTEPHEFAQDSEKYNSDHPSENEITLLYCEAVDLAGWQEITDLDAAEIYIGIFLSCSDEIVAGFVRRNTYENLHLPGQGYELRTLYHAAPGSYHMLLKTEQFLVDTDDHTALHESIRISMLRNIVIRESVAELLAMERDELQSYFTKRMVYLRHVREMDLRQQFSLMMQTQEAPDPLEITVLKMHFKGSHQDAAEILLQGKHNPHDHRSPAGRSKDADTHISSVLFLFGADSSTTLAPHLPADQKLFVMLCVSRSSELLLLITKEPKTGLVQTVGYPVYLADVSMTDYDFIETVMRGLPDQYANKPEEIMWHCAYTSILHNYFFYRSRLPFIYAMNRDDMADYVLSKYMRSLNQYFKHEPTHELAGSVNTVHQHQLDRTRKFSELSGLDMPTLLQYVVDPSTRPFPDFSVSTEQPGLEIAQLCTDPYLFKTKDVFGALISLVCMINPEGDICIALYDNPDIATHFEGDFYSEWIKIKGSSPKTYHVFDAIYESLSDPSEDRLTYPPETSFPLYVLLKHIDAITEMAEENPIAALDYSQKVLREQGFEVDYLVGIKEIRLQHLMQEQLDLAEALAAEE